MSRRRLKSKGDCKGSMEMSFLSRSEGLTQGGRLWCLFSLFSFPSLSMSPPLAFFIGSYTKLLDRLLICPRLRFHARRCAPARTVSHVSILPCSFLVCSSWQGEVVVVRINHSHKHVINRSSSQTMWESATMMVAMTRPRELSCTEKVKTCPEHGKG
ncbi:hypothetical protein IWX49DRAFT_94591 [Phyllosticta citricarpa]